MPTNDPPTYTAAQIRAADQHAIKTLGIPGLVLMENAGRAVARITRAAVGKDPEPRVTVLCGPGNNGGDGFVVARHLHVAGIPTIVVLAADRIKSRGDADTNLRIVERLGLPIADATTADGLAEARDVVAGASVVVDALLGTGAKGPLRAPMDALIVFANSSHGRRIAVDVPTGLDADTGEISSPCFQADTTVTLLAHKVGLLKPAAREVVGRLVLGDIGVAASAILPENPTETLDG